MKSQMNYLLKANNITIIILFSTTFLFLLLAIYVFIGSEPNKPYVDFFKDNKQDFYFLANEAIKYDSLNKRQDSGYIPVSFVKQVSSLRENLLNNIKIYNVIVTYHRLNKDFGKTINVSIEIEKITFFNYLGRPHRKYIYNSNPQYTSTITNYNTEMIILDNHWGLFVDYDFN